MAAPLWRLVCQTKSNRIQAVAQELVKISLFYIYMNRHNTCYRQVLDCQTFWNLVRNVTVNP